MCCVLSRFCAPAHGVAFAWQVPPCFVLINSYSGQSEERLLCPLRSPQPPKTLREPFLYVSVYSLVPLLTLEGTEGRDSQCVPSSLTLSTEPGTGQGCHRSHSFFVDRSILSNTHVQKSYKFICPILIESSHIKIVQSWFSIHYVLDRAWKVRLLKSAFLPCGLPMTPPLWTRMGT